MDSDRQLKRPKLEIGSDSIADGKVKEEEGNSFEEQEEALIALIAHREAEVNQNKQRVAHYQSQLENSQKKLEESKLQLARLQSKRKHSYSAVVKSSDHDRSQGRTQLNIPAANSKNLSSQQSQARSSSVKKESRASPSVCNEKKAKKKLEQRVHQELIRNIRTTASPDKIVFQPSILLPSQHRRKMRSIVLNPLNDQLFITSALDGAVNLWQLQPRGSSISLLSSTDCMSPKKRWPEDIAWHPDGDTLFAVYSADDGDSQISILDHNLAGDKKVTFLQDKPHFKGIINSILFMPWDDTCFATGGSDHAVILWKEKDNTWKPKSVHRTQHTSSVMGIAGMYHKKVVLSVGTDKRIVGFDITSERAEFKHMVDSKCLSVLPNPVDFNLFMVQSGTPGKQLRLFDIRQRQTEIHSFGWKQTSSESQSALINQAWSPNGLHLSSGSADPMIHIFDIRFKSSVPSQSVQAHHKRVFKAVWHTSLPLLTSISSDLNIGLHRIS